MSGCAEQHREIVKLRLEGFSYGQIASHLDVSRSAVAGALHRALLTDAASTHASNRQKHSPEFRRSVATAEGRVTMVARRFGVSHSQVRVWRRRHRLLSPVPAVAPVPEPA